MKYDHFSISFKILPYYTNNYFICHEKTAPFHKSIPVQYAGISQLPYNFVYTAALDRLGNLWMGSINEDEPGFAAGIYYCRLESVGESIVRKMILQK